MIRIHIPEKTSILFLLLIIAMPFIGKTQYLEPPPEYYTFVKKGDSLMASGKYRDASNSYHNAVISFKGSALPFDRYKLAQAYGLCGNKDSLIATLNHLTTKSRYYNYVNLFADTAFKIIRGTPAFEKIISNAIKSKEMYAPNENFEWSLKLKKVFDEDQKRAILLNPSRMQGMDSADAKIAENILEMRRIDSANLVFVTNFLDKYGWQGKDVVGLDGSYALFLVIQHADSATRKKYLPMLREAVQKGNAEPNYLALVEDRISVEETGKQIYGSQVLFVPDLKIHKVYPIINEKEVNKRRAMMGMEPLEAYLKYFNIEYKPEVE